jgi:hypothetical protein
MSEKYKDHQYIKTYESSHLSEQTNHNGKVVYATKTEVKHYDINLANMQGMKSMKVKKLFEIHDEIIKSNIDAKLFTYLVTNQSETSKVISSGKNGASVKYLAGKFLVTERKVQQFVSEAIKLDLLKRIGKDLYLNPYLSKPFTATNNMLHQLQIWWDSEPEIEIQFISTKDLKENIIKNTSKIIGEIK